MLHDCWQGRFSYGLSTFLQGCFSSEIFLAAACCARMTIRPFRRGLTEPETCLTPCRGFNTCAEVLTLDSGFNALSPTVSSSVRFFTTRRANVLPGTDINACIPISGACSCRHPSAIEEISEELRLDSEIMAEANMGVSKLAEPDPEYAKVYTRIQC